jgi:hypothetical protein
VKATWTAVSPQLQQNTIFDISAMEIVSNMENTLTELDIRK